MWWRAPLKPVAGLPAAYAEKLNLAVIADIHIGYETELAREGVFLPRTQISSLIRQVTRLREAVGPSRLLINGDLKHSFSRLSRQERREVSEFMGVASAMYREVIVVRGNHDNYLVGLLRDFGVELLDSYSEGEILFIHGHRDPGLEELGKYRWVVIGHEHPAVIIRDKFGYKYRFPVFLYTPTSHGFTVVVLPAFSTLSSGNVVSVDREGLLSPILKKYGDVASAVPVAFGEEFGLAELPTLGILSEL